MNFTLPKIAPLNEAMQAAAQARQNNLTKPAGSLGRLEELSVQLAGILEQERPSLSRKAVIVMAGDHGVVAEGVSAFPAEVTPQMVLNFLHGGAAINALAKAASARVIIVDMGVAVDMPDHPDLIKRKIAYGTQNMAVGPAMTREQAEAALQAGIDIVTAEIEKGLDLVAVGEMGIGNTTPATAITAALTGIPVAQLTGRGTGVDDAGLVKKVAVIEKALAVNKPDSNDAMDVLMKVGGLEIAGLAGVVLGAAAQRVPVVIDGFISSSAAMIAAELVPAVKPYLIGSHESVEIGHQAILRHLGVRPLFDLNMRLGEGTGAAIAFNIIEGAARVLDEMATFAEAGVSSKD